MLHSTTGDILTLGFLTAPQNTLLLRNSLRKTGLGHSSQLRFDDDHNPKDGTDTYDQASSEPDFDAAEP